MISLKRNSQIARFLLTWYGRLPYTACSLFWSLVGTITTLIVFGVAVGLVFAAYVLGFIEVLHFLFLGYTVMPIFGGLFIGLNLTIILVGLILWNHERPRKTKAGVIYSIYLSWKDKFCPTITWK